jgi:hypothetical protein
MLEEERRIGDERPELSRERVLQEALPQPRFTSALTTSAASCQLVELFDGRGKRRVEPTKTAHKQPEIQHVALLCLEENSSLQK